MQPIAVLFMVSIAFLYRISAGHHRLQAVGGSAPRWRFSASYEKIDTEVKARNASAWIRFSHLNN